LEVEALTAGYGRTLVLRSLTMAAGEFGNVGLFGPNGHGKTTLLRAISGLVRAQGGRVRFGETDITALRPRDIVAMGLIHVPQANRLFPDLTIAECLTLGAHSPHARPHEAENREKVVAIFPKLAERWRQRISGRFLEASARWRRSAWR
jgi:branched-chain amino acid transport system ATP-binding protein